MSNNLTARIDSILSAWDTGHGFDRIEETKQMLRQYKELAESTVPRIARYEKLIDKLQHKIIDDMYNRVE